MFKKTNMFFLTLLVVAHLVTSTMVTASADHGDSPGETVISSKTENLLEDNNKKMDTLKDDVKSSEAGETQVIPEIPIESKKEPANEETKSEELKMDMSERILGTEEDTSNSIILIEGDPNNDDPVGYHIDKNFAELLRSNSSVQAQGSDWSGYGKAPNTLTSNDMENLTEYLSVSSRNLSSLKGIEYAVNLKILMCNDNQLDNLNVDANTALIQLDCSNNQLSSLDTTMNSSLIYLSCKKNQLSSLNVDTNVLLNQLICSNNQLISLNVSMSSNLKVLDCSDNRLSNIDVSNNTELTHLDCRSNRLNDITSVYNLSNLSFFDASNQSIVIPVPIVSPNRATVIDVLQTTAQTGLSISNINIIPAPTNIFSIGDKINIEGVTREALGNKSIKFEYNSSQLSEGASNATTKVFSGVITFSLVSDLKNELRVDKKRAKSGEVLVWTWTITNILPQKAENIRAQFSLTNWVPNDISNIIIDGRPGSISNINGSTNLGDLNENETLELSFETKVSGSAEEWLEGLGILEWRDSTLITSHYNESKHLIKILDEEQTDTLKESEGMGILSVPIYFNFGTQEINSSLKKHFLYTQNYQSNTKVVTDGFYVRVHDDRLSRTGWKLTARLSEFVDESNVAMPNSSGISLNLDNMEIQQVTNLNTPQEEVISTSIGRPSTVQTAETLVAGEPAKILVSAEANEGVGTWQLRMPFNNVSLNVPANAGQKETKYKSKLTWSLENTLQ